MIEIYITYFLQILSFSSPFRRFEMRNFLRRPLVGLQNFFHFYRSEQYQGLDTLHEFGETIYKNNKK